jgi:hypothetical protein
MSSQPRGNLVHFLGPKDSDSSTVFTRLAKGVSELSSTMNPQTREVTYIDDQTDSITTAYQRSWAVSSDVYTENDANEMLYELTFRQAKGDDAVVYMVVAQLWKPSENNPTLVYQGYKQKCSWVPDNDGGGTGGETVTFSGSLNAKGDPTYGWVDITRSTDADVPWTGKFTETEPAVKE